MKVKRQKQNRRHLRFFRTCCGFREPFKVVCDGNFLHHVLTLGLTDVHTSIPRLLTAETRLFTTKCVIAELSLLGEPFKDAAALARKLLTARCDHRPAVVAADCLAQLVKEDNPQHFFIATQDLELKAALRQMPAAGAIHARGTALVLDPPSSAQLAAARAREASRQHLPEHEQQQLLLLRKKKVSEHLASRHMLTSSAAGDVGMGGDDPSLSVREGVLQEGGGVVLVGENGLLETREAGGVGEGDNEADDVKKKRRKGLEGERVDWRAGYGRGGHGATLGEDEDDGEAGRRKKAPFEKDSVRFKRKRAKAPNPLSCKKKKGDSSLGAGKPSASSFSQKRSSTQTSGLERATALTEGRKKRKRHKRKSGESVVA